ncbi:MAG: hypothetical protein C0597_00700 [Marinilabiliales bacterium]|mgnify:CR=1 FL=1|nr:MAG: hypothetical protein C0597_00700 [Marinilabiliales bacterium]
MKKLISLIVLFLFVAFIYTACEEDENTKGTVSISITDAPVDMSKVSAVYLTITEIQLNVSGNSWITLDEFEGPQKFNILELTDGNSELMGSFTIDAGHYSQLRFYVDAPEQSDANPSNPGCYIEFEDAPTQALFVPSGSNSGWKAVGGFDVPLNGEVSITVDFDARKSIMEQGANDFYILKPTIRTIVENEAGKIVGGLSNIPEGIDVVIYAYEDGIYTSAEAEDPMSDTTARFPNAVTSDIVDDNDSYHLAFLAAGTYDLIVTTSIDGEFQEVLGIVEDVEVESNTTTTEPIDLSAFIL